MSPTNIFKKTRPFPKGSHEQKVYEFYRHGAGNFGDFHGGYLNFGLWEDDVRNYVEAAGKLVHRLGDLVKLAPESRLLDVACGMGSQDVYLVRNFAVRSTTRSIFCPSTWRIPKGAFGRRDFKN